MANTYSQLNIQAVFAVKGRGNFILKPFRENLFKYMSGILRNENCYPLSVGGWRDHVHLFFELDPSLTISGVIGKVKASSSKWMNERGFIPRKFNWQKGYGAFSYSRSQRPRIIQYIMNQEEHHRVKTFREEYFKMLKDFEIKYDEKYLFEFYD